MVLHALLQVDLAARRQLVVQYLVDKLLHVILFLEDIWPRQRQLVMRGSQIRYFTKSAILNALPGIEPALVIQLVHLLVICECVTGSNAEIIQDLSSLPGRLFCLVNCFQDCVALNEKWIKNE